MKDNPNQIHARQINLQARGFHHWANSESGFLNFRALIAFTLCSVGVFLAALGFAATPTPAGWSLITSPNTSATEDNVLSSVACSSASDCWAVGHYRTGPHNYQQTLIEHWNGTSWAIVPSPNATTTGNNVLSAVTCASASGCWAVGFYNNPNSQTLIEQWNGTAWAIVASPNNGTASGLSGVTCASASECWAVGSYTYSTGLLSSAVGTLIEHWTASSNSWAVFASPNYSNLDSSLVAVACASASECWAIGSAGNSEIIEYWTANSNSWAIVVSPNTNPNFGENTVLLKAVTCASASECWAVGYYFDSTAADPVYYAFIERWNGTSWALVPSPNTDVLTGVTCASASDCWVVGNINHWDGTSWAIVTSPNAGGYLNGVTCASASECWAVGSYVNASGYSQTLIEEFAPTIPPLTSVVSRKVHGNAGTFDINLPLIGTRGVECRSTGGTGTPGVDYKLVFSFVNDVTNCGNASTGSLSSGPNSNQCTVDLTGIADQQYVTVNLNNVLDSQTNTGNVSATMGVLLGDVNANGLVNSTDTTLVQAQSGKALTLSNFRMDVNHNGLINSTDTSAVQARSGHGLSPPPP